MTLLCASTYGDDREHHLFFRTSDGYPHISDRENNSTPFHLLRMGDKTYYTSEVLMFLLKEVLNEFDFSFHTECPEIETMEYEEIAYRGVRAALLDFGRNIIVSTIVVPEGDKVDTP